MFLFWTLTFFNGKLLPRWGVAKLVRPTVLVRTSGGSSPPAPANKLFASAFAPCGAVTAAVEGEEAYGYIGVIVKKIKPSVEKAKQEKGESLDNAIMKNATSIVKEICNANPVLKTKVATERIRAR